MMDIFILPDHKIIYMNIALLTLLFAAFGAEMRFANVAFSKTNFIKKFISLFIIPYTYIPLFVLIITIPIILWTESDHKFIAIYSIMPITGFISSILLIHSLKIISHHIKEIEDPEDAKTLIELNTYLRYIYIFLGLLTIIAFILGIIGGM